jgi:hypothetical protein
MSAIYPAHSSGADHLLQQIIAESKRGSRINGRGKASFRGMGVSGGDCRRNVVARLCSQFVVDSLEQAAYLVVPARKSLEEYRVAGSIAPTMPISILFADQFDREFVQLTKYWELAGVVLHDPPLDGCGSPTVFQIKANEFD